MSSARFLRIDLACIFLSALAASCSIYDRGDLDDTGSGGSVGSGTGGVNDSGLRSGTAGAGGAGLGAASGAGGATGSGGIGGTVDGGTDSTAGTGGLGGSANSGGSAGLGGQSGATGGAGTGSGGRDGAADTTVFDVASNDGARDEAASDAAVTCEGVSCKRVFVTSQASSMGANLSGLSGADASCQATAGARQLGGTWKAWLSDSVSSPSTRFTHATTPYRLLDGSIIAADWTALTRGTLMHPINVSEDGIVHSEILEVWTGTTPAGAYAGRSCAGWTNGASGPETGDVGQSNETGPGWSNHHQQYCNRITLRLFCFEQ